MKMRSKMQNEKGFTLVELMVVVVILGILVAIAVPVYNSVTQKADISAIKANLRTIDGAIMTYQATNDVAAGADITQDNAQSLLQKWPEGPKGVTYKVEANRGAIAGVGTMSDIEIGDNVEDIGS